MTVIHGRLPTPGEVLRATAELIAFFHQCRITITIEHLNNDEETITIDRLPSKKGTA